VELTNLKCSPAGGVRSGREKGKSTCAIDNVSVHAVPTYMAMHVHVFLQILKNKPGSSLHFFSYGARTLSQVAFKLSTSTGDLISWHSSLSLDPLIQVLLYTVARPVRYSRICDRWLPIISLSSGAVSTYLWKGGHCPQLLKGLPYHNATNLLVYPVYIHPPPSMCSQSLERGCASWKERQNWKLVKLNKCSLIDTRHIVLLQQRSVHSQW
jgi:hypothetical protein